MSKSRRKSAPVTVKRKATRKISKKSVPAKRGKPATTRKLTKVSKSAKDKKPVKRSSSITAADLAARLRVDFTDFPPPLQGTPHPIALVRVQYASASDRTIRAALNLLASEGLVTILNNDTFHLDARAPQPPS